MNKIPVLSAILIMGICAVSAANPLMLFQGACDGSGAVAIDKHRFLNATDEDNFVRLYDTEVPGAPVKSFDLEELFSLSAQAEMDIEGATRIGDELFFISSNKRSKKGKLRSGRHLFALNVALDASGAVSLTKVGRPYVQLADALESFDSQLGYSVNIEGLSIWKKNQLLIGFRSPTVDDKALLVPLVNPLAVVQSGEKPKFGEAIKLALAGQGVRAIEYWPERFLYVIVAGSPEAHGEFRIYTWSGDPKDGAVAGPSLAIDAESVVVFPGEKKRVLLLSDDSGERSEAGKCKCRDIPAGDLARTFRAQWISL
ncbi:MAG: DUF3616 domain-containing protein [Candidatus Obscuribacterales bacterium]|nr:DUF3616 domain-containing protein [Candidatus Obscuribacterales bacterium]